MNKRETAEQQFARLFAKLTPEQRSQYWQDVGCFGVAHILETADGDVRIVAPEDAERMKATGSSNSTGAEGKTE